MDVEPEGILQSAGLEWDSCTPIPGGLQHDLYRVSLRDSGLTVLKVGKPDAPFGDTWEPLRTHAEGLRAEAQALDYLLRQVPVPTPYRVLEGAVPAALMGFLRGDSALKNWERGRVSVEHLHGLCFTLGQALAEIHRVRRPEDPGDIPDLPGAMLEDARLLHQDFHLGNVMVARDGLAGWKVLGLVDWVLCRWGPREADLVEMSISVFRQVQGTRAAFLGGYRNAGGAPLTQELENLWVHQELLRRLEQGIDDPKTRARWQMWEQDIRMGRGHYS